MNRRNFFQTAATAAVATSLTAANAPALAQSSGWAARKRRARVRGLNMAYYEVGEGDPILFLHGNPTSSYLWRNIIPHVQHSGRCIAPDMIGMGDSDRLPDSGPGKYNFATHRDFLFELFEELGVTDNVTLVLHDWGSGVGFSWAQQHTASVKGIAYFEAILRPPSFPATPEPTAGPFAIFRSPRGEQAVLQDNMFVEQMLIGGLQYYLTEEDKAEYRRPFLEAGENRRPALTWPRELPMAGGPADTTELVTSYTEWLQNDTQVPKLFIRGVPGAIFANPQMLEYVRAFNNQQEVTVYGTHYLQEFAPDAIGRALVEWIPSLS